MRAMRVVRDTVMGGMRNMRDMRVKVVRVAPHQSLHEGRALLSAEGRLGCTGLQHAEEGVSQRLARGGVSW